MTKRWKWSLVIVVATTSLIAVLVIRWAWFPGRAFDSVVWQDETHVKQGARLEMADRLIARRALLGKSRAEVVGMLGEPSATAKFGDWDLVYWLGPERGYFSIDSEWLVLRLAENGLVIDNRLVRD